MENYRLIIAGTIGSVITLFFTAVFDYLKEVYRAKRDDRKIAFQRRIEIAEYAVAWFQESIDCYTMMQIACEEMSEENNPVVWDKFMKSSIQAYNLYLDTPKKLNRLYLYFDTLDIEKKHNLVSSAEQINHATTELGKLDQEAVRLQGQGLTEDNKEIKHLKQNAIGLFRQLSKSLDSQIEALSEMISTLRSEYRKYFK
ncbi:MAG: hypothetical protein J6J25_05060 [Bacteroidales bacterium]|nr:hypothetical protein [Bacteroidales bacterium]